MLSYVSKGFHFQKACRKGSVRSATRPFWYRPNHETLHNQQESSAVSKSNIWAALNQDRLGIFTHSLKNILDFAKKNKKKK